MAPQFGKQCGYALGFLKETHHLFQVDMSVIVRGQDKDRNGANDRIVGFALEKLATVHDRHDQVEDDGRGERFSH